MGKNIPAIKHPRKEVGNKHTNPAKYRDHQARPSTVTMPADANTLTERLKSGQVENSSGKYYLLAGAAAIGLYLYMYQG